MSSMLRKLGLAKIGKRRNVNKLKHHEAKAEVRARTEVINNMNDAYNVADARVVDEREPISRERNRRKKRKAGKL